MQHSSSWYKGGVWAVEVEEIKDVCAALVTGLEYSLVDETEGALPRLLDGAFACEGRGGGGGGGGERFFV